MVEAKIVLDSINPAGHRITTWLLTYPRFIHSEFMTHRIFSRNAASSRAIPSSKIIEAIRSNPAKFEQVGRANKGMSAHDTCSPAEAALFHEFWNLLGGFCCNFVEEWSPRIAKQVVNRAVESWMHMTVLATATDHSNFFKLRAHPAAQPEFQVLAYRMLNEYVKSAPQQLQWEEWHLPGLDLNACDMFDINQRLKLCVALGCRASYSAFESPLAFDDAERIHDRGVENGHWSPFEHPAQAINWNAGFKDDAPGLFGSYSSYPWSNFDFIGDNGARIPSGWGQYRKLFPTECARNFSNEELTAILNNRPAWVKV